MLNLLRIFWAAIQPSGRFRIIRKVATQRKFTQTNDLSVEKEITNVKDASQSLT